MKRMLSALFAFSFICSFTLGATQVNGQSMATSSQPAFTYSITPQSSEWKTFTPLELKNRLNIPIEEAERIATSDLLDVVLAYPFLGDIYAFDNPTTALDFLAAQFNGLKVLLKRDDLKKCLTDNYREASEKILRLTDSKSITNEERCKQRYRESLFSYPAVFNELTKTEIADIVSTSERVAAEIAANPITAFAPGTFGSAVSVSASPGDTIRTGVVYTPAGSGVAVFERAEMTIETRNSMDAYMASVYPNATRLRSATFKYNCHSYAWY
jgi:hypothetical protein